MLLTHDRSSVLKAQAQFNIALYHEMKDNLQEAVRWINAAENTLSKDKDKFRASNTYTLIEQYKQALGQREEDMKGIENYYNKKTNFIQSTPAPGLLEFPDEFMPTFYPEGKRAAGGKK